MKENSKLIGSSVFTDFSRFYILLLLFEGQDHGYQIMKTLENRLGHTFSPSLVYPFLILLQEQGYVKSWADNTSQKRAKNIYTLTPRGRALCSDLFKQFTKIVSSAIEPSMHTCAHCGCSVYKDAYEERIGVRSAWFCCRYCAAAYKKSRGGSS